MCLALQGIAASRISIITTYNGQKDLIHDVVSARCAGSPVFGTPAKIATTDKFQGQQNDFILLSLVRTKSVGHLRGTITMSRTRSEAGRAACSLLRLASPEPTALPHAPCSGPAV